MDKPQLGFFAPIIEPGVHSKSIPCFYFFTKKISVRTNEQRFLYLIYCAVVFLPGSTEFGRFQWKRMDIRRSATISAAHKSIHSVFGR